VAFNLPETSEQTLQRTKQRSTIDEHPSRHVAHSVRQLLIIPGKTLIVPRRRAEADVPTIYPPMPAERAGESSPARHIGAMIHSCF
jgi:hypothetical protein